MDLSDDAIKKYLLTSCSNNYFTPGVIAGFAKNEAFRQETPKEGWSNYLRKRDEILSELNQEFSLKRVDAILEKLVEENKLEKDIRQVHKGRKLIDRTVYRLPADKSTKSQ